jgi:hypothetical protein
VYDGDFGCSGKHRNTDVRYAPCFSVASGARMSELSLAELDGDSLPQSSDRLQILSHEEYELLWRFPRFTQSDRDLFFTLTAPEREALEQRRSIRAKIHFLLHLGYFRARQRFFRFDLPAVRDDVDYLSRCYFDNQAVAADIVILDDNFALIASGVEEGRAVFANMQKFTTYVLASNTPEIAPFLLYVLLPVPLALTVIQILFIDLGTDLLPAIGLGQEPPRARLDETSAAATRSTAALLAADDHSLFGVC